MNDISSLAVLQTILSKIDAEKPAAQGLLGRTEHQMRDDDFLKRLKLEAIQRTNSRVLVTGQIGVGKSSELNHFFYKRFTEPQRTGFWVYCDLEKGEHPERCGATGVLLTILRDCWGATKSLQERLRASGPGLSRMYDNVRSEILEALIDWLKANISPDGKRVVFRFGGMDFPVSLSDKDSALGLILSKVTQHEAVSTRSERLGLVPDRLVNTINHLFRWVSALHSNRKPLIILDHVDKIRDETAAREVLVELIPQWKRLDASVIMTAPYEYTLGEMRNSVESYWGKPLMIYPIGLPELDSQKVPDFYIGITKSCGLDEALSFEVLRVLAHFSGGIPRTFVQFLLQTVKEAHLAGHKNVLMSDAQAVIFAAQMAYQDYSPKQLDLLEQIGKNKIGLGSAAVLLRSPIGLLVFPQEGGRQKFRIHPLAENVLYNYQKVKKEP